MAVLASVVVIMHHLKSVASNMFASVVTSFTSPLLTPTLSLAWPGVFWGSGVGSGDVA